MREHMRRGSTGPRGRDRHPSGRWRQGGHPGAPRVRAVWALAILAILSSCGPRYLAGSKVPDTEDTRAVYQVLVAYRDALVARDPDRILALVSPKYLENGSTTDDPSDDYGYQELAEKVLPELLDNVKAIQFDFRLENIQILGDRAKIQYEYTTHFLYSEGGREGWHTQNDFNELELERTPDGWRIVGGL